MDHPKELLPHVTVRLYRRDHRCYLREQLSDWICDLGSHVDQLQEWIRFRESEAALHQLDVLQVLHEVMQRQIPVEQAADAFLGRFYRVWLDCVYQEDTALREFRLIDHEKLIATFRELDREIVCAGYAHSQQTAVGPTSSASMGSTAPATSELGLLMCEVEKHKRHMPLRQLFRRIPRRSSSIEALLDDEPTGGSTFLNSPTELLHSNLRRGFAGPSIRCKSQSIAESRSLLLATKDNFRPQAF